MSLSSQVVETRLVLTDEESVRLQSPDLSAVAVCTLTSEMD